MGNQYGQDNNFEVYEIVSNGQVRDFQTFYGLIYVGSFNSHHEAATWINDEGKRQVKYTIIETYRNK